MKYTIAEILHLAADKKLASKESQCWTNGGSKEKFSCCAVSEAVFDLYNCDKIATTDEREELINRTIYGLRIMGCPTASLSAFDDAGKFNAENQQARYAWLKFAATMTEEQGV